MKVNRQNDCRNCLLPVNCFSQDAKSTQVAELSAVIQERLELKKNETLFNQQEKFRGLFAVKKGGIKTFLISEAGEQVITGFYLAGEILGFDAVHSEKYMENAAALTNAEICRIPFGPLLELASKDAVLQKELFKLFSCHIKQISQHFHYNAEQKVATFLYDYSCRLQRQHEDYLNFHILPTQQDIASYLDLTPETVSRVFHKFLDLGIYQSNRTKQIEALDLQKLQQIISLG